MPPTGEGIAVVREVVIAASPETIWQFLIDPIKSIRWMGVAATFDARAGGRYRIEVLPGDAVLGEFVELDPPRRLVQTWGWERRSGSMPEGSTTVAFDLVPGDGGTLVRMTHTGLSRGTALDRHVAGWDHYLPRLVSVASGGDPGPDPWIERPEL